MTGSPALPVLYSFRRCPYAMRARLTLLAAGQACALREVVLRDKPEALRQASPKATVPVLVLPDGQVLEQSLDIMQWALGRADPGGWLTPSDGDLPQMLALIAANDGDFKQQLDRYKYPQRHADGVGTAARDAGARFLASLQDRLAAAPCLFGAHWTLADTAIAPFVRQFAGVDADWFAAQPWPALQAWLQGWQASPRFAQAMQKYPPWQADATPVVFARAGHGSP